VSQFGSLDRMQRMIDSTDTELDVEILGVNRLNAASANANAVAGRTIPWLQDTDSTKVWDSWRVTYRDVVVLDAENKVTAVYNLTSHDLSRPAAFESLMTIILEAAE
jgi:hypothetical protein